MKVEKYGTGRKRGMVAGVGRFALGVAALAMLGGCSHHERITRTTHDKTYTDDLEADSLRRSKKFVQGISCDTYAPFINLQLDVATTEKAMSLAMNEKPGTVALANVSIEVEHLYMPLNGVSFLQRCIIVSGQPMIKRGK